MQVVGYLCEPIVRKLEELGECHVPFLEVDSETHLIASLDSIPGVAVTTDPGVIHLKGYPIGKGTEWMYHGEYES